jgi:cytochrome c553
MPINKKNEGMKIKFPYIMSMLVSITGLWLHPALAGEAAAGKAKAEAMCQTCHGVDGVATTAMVANLSGQRKEYLKIQLEAYRSGRRQHEQMSIIAKMLTDEDIENLSEWYSSIKITVEMPQ